MVPSVSPACSLETFECMLTFVVFAKQLCLKRRKPRESIHRQPQGNRCMFSSPCSVQ
jgi:hypothetical protein